MKDSIENIFSAIGGLGVMVLFGSIGIGSLYWLWMAIQIGNFWMFVAGIFPMTMVFTAPIGAWSLIFGMPEWLINYVGPMPV